MLHPEEATDIRLTAEGAEVELYGRTAEISSDTPGEVDVTLTVTINGEEKSVTRTVRFFDPADNTHPKASFLTPEADSELKTKTEITGTVWDETGIAYYTLEYRMEGTDTFREISSGKEMVEEGILGELDTTLLENGRYLLRLTVVDNGGNRIRVERAINVTGNLKVGNLSLSFTDINANVSGVPLTVIRSYDSRNKTSGDFGTGWRLGLQSVRLTEANDITTGYEMVQQGIKFSTTYQIFQTICHDVTITYGDGTSDRFALKLSPERQGIIPIYEVKVNFVCETNPKLKLQLDGDNQALLYGEELVFDDESML